MRSQFNFFYSNFRSVQLAHYLLLSLPRCHQKTNTKLADNAKSRRTDTQLDLKTQHAIQIKYINRHPAKQNWNLKRILTPFWFQLLTIVSSSIGTDFDHRQLVVFRNAKIKIAIVTLITSYTNLAILKLVKHSSFQTLIHFTRTLLIFRYVIESMGSMSFLCHWMSW